MSIQTPMMSNFSGNSSHIKFGTPARFEFGNTFDMNNSVSLAFKSLFMLTCCKLFKYNTVHDKTIVSIVSGMAAVIMSLLKLPFNQKC